MATVTVQSIIDKAEILLQDTTNVRWSAAELVDWLNDGQREVALHKPESTAKNIAVILTAGSTKQALPTDGISLLRITRNMGAGGTTPGDGIRLVQRADMDAQVPTWHSDTNTAGKIKHYVFDPRDPKTYYVYPKAPATAWYVELAYSAVPGDCVAGGTIHLDDIYANALLDYVLYRAYSKDAETGNGQRAIAHYTAFANALGVKSQAEAAQNPNANTNGNRFNRGS